MAAAVAAERKHEVLSDDEGISVSVEDQKVNEDMPEAHDAAMKIESEIVSKNDDDDDDDQGWRQTPRGIACILGEIKL
ncbi:hypothetical protein WN944_006911 [Citrus x changshan-huyou]|uniref:Uncharacterized protein n=1 Tax=Citrus x changshan-huyou TaxID=2935761 RepID=A0AAP0MPV0_9ROSI